MEGSKTVALKPRFGFVMLRTFIIWLQGRNSNFSFLEHFNKKHPDFISATFKTSHISLIFNKRCPRKENIYF